MCAGVCVDMRGGVRMEYGHMYGHAYGHVCEHMYIDDRCIDMRGGMCIDMCSDMCIGRMRRACGVDTSRRLLPDGP